MAWRRQEQCQYHKWLEWSLIKSILRILQRNPLKRSFHKKSLLLNIPAFYVGEIRDAWLSQYCSFWTLLKGRGGQTHVKICPISKRPFDIGIRSWPSHEPFRLWALVMTWTAFSILAMFKVRLRTANFHQIIYNLNPLFVNFNNKQLQDMSKYVAYIWIMELCAYHFTNETVKAIF